MAVVSEALWRNRYGSDPNIVGKVVHINQHPYTVVGVVSFRSAYWMKGDRWVPYTMQAQFRQAHAYCDPPRKVFNIAIAFRFRGFIASDFS